MKDRPDITPELKVGALLDAYPELEETLVAAAPPFAKLRNPMLRRTVARMTSLRQAAAVGGVAVGRLVGQLRAEAGLDDAWTGEETMPASGKPRPSWVTAATPVSTLDARPAIDRGEMPLPAVLAAVEALAPGEVHVLVTPFLPAPLLERLAAAGCETWTERLAADDYRTHCRRVPG